MVAAGAHGFVAKHKNGQWKQVKFPSNIDLSGVCCRSEKEVYVAGRNRLAWRWDGEGRWKQLEVKFDGDPNDLTFCDLAEYEGVIYAAGAEHGIYRPEGDKFVPVPKVADEYVLRLRATASGLIGLGAVWSESGNWFTHFDGENWTAQQINIKL